MTGTATLVDALTRLAHERGDRLAVRSLDEPGGVPRELDYAGLDRRAREIATGLGDRTTPGDRVLLFLSQGLDFVTAFYGCLYARVLPVPVAPRRRPPFLDVVAAIARDAGARLVIAAPGARTAAVTETLVEGGADRVVEVETLGERGADDAPAPPPAPSDLAYLQYTSGTTNRPKGVMVSHANVVHNAQLLRERFAVDDRSLAVGWLPPHHDMGLVTGILAPVSLGFPTVLMSPDTFVRRPVSWLEAVSAHRATFSGGPDFAYAACTRQVTPDQMRGLDLSTWRAAFNGAEPVRAATLRAFAGRFAEVGFDGRAFVPCYGLAEATLLVAGWVRPDGPVVARADRAALHRGAQVRGTAPASETVELVGCETGADPEVVVVDEGGTKVADDVVGEIWVAGTSVARGYWDRPEESAATFGRTAAGSAAPFLATGDLGFRRGTSVFVRGREKDVLVVRGENHDPVDVEATAAAACGDTSGVGRLAVVAFDDGERERVLALYETAPRDAAQVDAIAAGMRRAVAATHGFVLDHVLGVRRRGIPLTTSGKIRRAACAEQLFAGSLAVVADDPVLPFHPPAG